MSTADDLIKEVQAGFSGMANDLDALDDFTHRTIKPAVARKRSTASRPPAFFRFGIGQCVMGAGYADVRNNSSP